MSFPQHPFETEATETAPLINSSAKGKEEAEPNAPLDPQVKIRIDKLPTFCRIKDLQAGDIVLFDKRSHDTISNQHSDARTERAHRKDIAADATVIGQHFLSEPGGHKQIIHAGCIIMHNGQLTLAHLEGSGLRLQPLADVPGSFINRTTYVSRPRPAKKNPHMIEDLNNQLSDLIGKVANAKDDGEKTVGWRKRVALKSIIGSIIRRMKLKFTDPAHLNKDEDSAVTVAEIANDSICSKFVADCYSAACTSLDASNDAYNYRARLMNVRGYIVPKSLQAYLDHNANYESLVIPYCNDQVLEILQGKIKSIALQFQGTKRDKAKGDALLQALDDFSPEHNEDLMQSAIRLMRIVWAIAPNIESLKTLAMKMGLYEKYYTAEAFQGRDQDKLSVLAQKNYGFFKGQAKLYSKFRHLGFNDAAAKVECSPNPTFSEWFQLNHTRKTVLSTLTLGIGHIGQFFYFKHVTHKIKVRHAALLAEDQALRQKNYQ